jgi:hypothetical protein
MVFSRVLSQDKSCFDRPENEASGLMQQLIVKDGDDARALIGVVVGQIVAIDDRPSPLGNGLGVAIDTRRASYWTCLPWGHGCSDEPCGEV